MMPTNTSSTAKTVRDFLYVDNDRLYSLYSQVFEGVAESMAESVIKSQIDKKSQQGEFMSGRSAEQQFATATLQTESGVLYDHMYTRLEEAVRPSLVELGPLTRHNLQDHMAEVALIKVQGNAFLEDYAYMQNFAGRWSEVADAIFDAVMMNVDTEEQKKQALKQLKEISDRNERARKKALIESKTDRDKLKKKLGLHIDETLVQHVQLILDLFYEGGVELRLERKQDRDVGFRGILDKQWLRTSLSTLKMLHGGSDLGGDWQMMGHVSFIPQDAPDPTETASFPEKETDLLRDKFRALFGHAHTMRETLIRSGGRMEVHISPIAIYRESEIEVST